MLEPIYSVSLTSNFVHLARLTPPLEKPDCALMFDRPLVMRLRDMWDAWDRDPEISFCELSRRRTARGGVESRNLIALD